MRALVGASVGFLALALLVLFNEPMNHGLYWFLLWAADWPLWFYIRRDRDLWRSRAEKVLPMWEEALNTGHMFAVVASQQRQEINWLLEHPNPESDDDIVTKAAIERRAMAPSPAESFIAIMQEKVLEVRPRDSTDSA